jgi:hypothetical protein
VLALHLPDDQRASAAHRLADDQFKKGRSVVVAKARKAFRTAWPLAGVGFGVAVNALWIAVLGYCVSKLFLTKEIVGIR